MGHRNTSLAFAFNSLLAATLLAGTAMAQTPSAPLKVMLYNKLNTHPDARQRIETMMNRIKTTKGFELYIENNQDNMTLANLKKYQVVVWTSNEQGRGALKETLWPDFQKYIEEGGGYVGMHSATGNGAKEWPWVSCMTVQMFDGHVPPGTTGLLKLNKVDSKRPHPAHMQRFFEGLKEPGVIADEYYMWQNDPRTTNQCVQMHGAKALAEWQTPAYGGDSVWVMINIDENLMSTPFGRKMGEHPLVWARDAKLGKFVSASIGHDDIWAANQNWGDEFAFRMIKWAAGEYHKTPVATQPRINNRKLDARKVMELSSLGIEVKSLGSHDVIIRSLDGKLVRRHGGRGPATYGFFNMVPGFYRVTLRTVEGILEQKVLKY